MLTIHAHRAADRHAIEQLNDEFCHQLDRGNVEGFVALFTADALYTNGPRVLRGEPQIRQFYLDRTRNGPRTSRHFTQGLRIEFTGDTSARGLSAAFTFSAQDSPPIESTIPAMVADEIATEISRTAPRASLQRFANCGHVMNLEQPAEFTEQVLRFAAGLQPHG
jgi:pimeloyl-ACP methyl ester carboxylesterase